MLASNTTQAEPSSIQCMAFANELWLRAGIFSLPSPSPILTHQPLPWNHFLTRPNSPLVQSPNRTPALHSSGVCQFWKKRKQWSTSPTITRSPWRWSFSKHTKWRTRERRGKSIDQNCRLFLFYRAFYLSFRYYELGSTLRTGSNHSCAIVLRLSRA